jgi:hypothetical protein
LSWQELTIAPDGTHHLTRAGEPAYRQRFDEVLKFHAPGLAAVRRSGLAWHILPDGSAAYERRFARTFGFYEGLAAVTATDGWHHVTPDGRDAYSARYAWCGNYQSDRCTVREPSGHYLHLGPDGQPAYACRWRYAGDYRDGVAVVQAEDGRSTHVDLAGQPTHARWFLDLDVFHKGFARARDDAGWTHVDEKGRPAYSRRFAAVEPFYNGQARVERFDGALEVIDESGEPVLQLRPPRRSELAALSADLVGFWRTQTIAAAVRLGVVEALPASEDELAERCDLSVVAVERLLRGLAELHLVTRHGGTWELTPRGLLLRAAHPLTFADAALEYAGPFSRMWEALPDALRAGSEWRGPDVFGQVARDEGRRRGHHRMLRSYARHDYPEVAIALALRGNERVIDAGGGLGSLAQSVLLTYPSTRVTVLDRPEVVEQGREEATASGLDWHAADLFEPWGLTADVVLLARVLHDWEDDAALRILSHAHAALAPRGRLFVIEMLLDEGSAAGALCDLHLLVVTGGRERTLQHLERLFHATGFRLEGVRALPALPSILVGVRS